jgi:hypothetical protein
MKKGRACAYCGETGTLTKEHVFPDCFQKTFVPITPARTPVGEKAVLGALKIGDVCARCNNGPLSELDSYLCQLNNLYFSKIVRPGDCIRFQYDFDLLLRMLLKIGYNVARSRTWSLGHWRETQKYILGDVSCPTDFHILLQLMVPTPVEKSNRPVTPGTTEVPPWPMSVYPIEVADLPGLTSGSWTSVWSYRFFILRENMLAPRSLRRQTLAKCRKNIPGAYELTRRSFVTAYASSVDVLAVIRNSRIFDEQLSEARRVKATEELRRSRKP